MKFIIDTSPPRSRILHFLFLLVAAFCLAGPASANPKAGTVTVGTQSPNPVVVGTGTTADYVITVNRGSGNGAFDVDLAAQGLPAGVTATWGSPASSAGSLSFSGSDNSKVITLHLNIATSVAGGTFTGISVKATVQGAASDNATSSNFNLVVANPPAPTITSISPTTGPKGSVVNVTVNGTNFVSGRTSVSISGSGITAGTAVVNSATQLVVPVTIASNAGGNVRDVSVTISSPGGGTATLNNAFMAVAAASADNTSTSVTGPANPTFGATTTYTATVTNTSGATTPTGNVQFVVDGSNFGSPVALNGSGQASITPTFNAGSHTVAANYAGVSGSFNASNSGNFAVNVAQATQTITFPAIADKTYGDAPFTVTISGGGSGNNVTLTTSGNITLSTNSVPAGGGNVTVTITGAGPASITANQLGNPNYSAAPAVTRNFNVAKATPTITFSQADRSFGSGSFQLTATISPNSLPLAYTMLSSPTGVSISASGFVTVTSPTATNASVQVKASFAGDSNYNAASQTITFNVKENVAPTTAKAVTQGTLGTNGWYKSGPDVVVHLSAADGGGSGVDHISYSVDSGAFVDVNGGDAFVTLTADGTHDIVFKATDNNGNVSSNDSVQIKLDRTAPVIADTPARLPDFNGWYNHDVSITFAATDATASPAVVDVPVATLTGAADEHKSVTVVATDAAGNTASHTFEYKFDADAPDVLVGGVSQNGSYHDGNVSALTVTEPYEASRQLLLSDANPTAGSFFDYNAQPGVFHAIPSLPFAITTEGNYTLHVVVTDLAGNSTVQNIKFTVDQSAPAIDVTGVMNGGRYRITPVGAAWSISDNLDLSPYWLLQTLFGDIYGQNGFAYVNSTDTALATAPGLGEEGRFKLNLKGEDHAHNVRAIDEITFFIDFSAPDSGAQVQNGTLGDNNWYTSLVDVLVSAADKKLRAAHDGLDDIDGTGVASLEYSKDGGATWLPISGISGLINLSAQGETIIRTRSTDNTGNAETEHDALTVKIDTVKPSFTSIPAVDGGRATERGGKTVTFPNPVADDATSGVASVGTVPASGGNFAIGTTHVTATARDNAGNVHTQVFDVTVGKIIQTITFNVTGSATYGDAPIALTATTNATGPTIPVTYTVTGPAHLSGSNLVIDGAGTVVITAHAAGDTEYEAAEDVERTITVGKKAIDVTADNQTKVYGAANPALTYQVSGLVGSDSLVGVTTSLSDTSAHVAIGATIQVTGPAQTDNYTVTYHDGHLTVTPSALTITADNKSREYGLSNPAFTASFDGLTNGDTQSAVGTVTLATSATQPSPVGGYPITASGASSTDYTITFVDGTLTITKADLTVAPNPASRLYGDANPTFTGTVSGARNGDTFTVTFNTAADPTSPVGTYSIFVESVNGAAAGNYNIDDSATANLTVNKAPLTITVDDATLVYGAEIPSLTGTIVGIKNNDSITATYGTSAVQGSHAGTYAIAATLNDPDNKLGNYDVTNTPGTLTITRAPLTIRANDATKVYGDANPAFTADYEGFVNNDSEASLLTPVQFSTPAGEMSNVGTYPITPSGATSDDYEITFVDGTLTITKATPTVHVNGGTFTYDGNPHPATGSVTGVHDQDLGAPTFTYNDSSDEPVHAGTYHVVATYAESQNYFGASAEATITINKAEQTISFAPIGTKTYGDVPFSLSATATSGLAVSFEVISGPATISGNTLTITGAGTVTVRATQGGGDDYLPADPKEQTFVVEKAHLTVKAVDAEITYGQPLPSFNATYSGFMNGDDPADLGGALSFTSDASNGSPAGTYYIRPGGLTSANYDIQFVDGSLTIHKANLTVTIDNKSKVYGAALPQLTAHSSGLVNGDTLESLGLQINTTATAASPAGTYPITGSGVAETNYVVTYQQGTLTVDKATLTVNVDDKSKVYGAAVPTLTASAVGLVNGDTLQSLGLQLSTTATQSSSVGTYPITGSGVSDANYSVTYNPGTLTVTKAPLTITIDDKSKVYGAALPTLTATPSGLVNGDTLQTLGLQIGTTATAGSPVGTYPITGSGASASNYDITYVPGTLTVTKAPLTITLEDKSKVYGASMPTLAATSAGLVNGDTLQSLGLQISSTATASSPVGTYPITGSGASESNYTITYVPGTLTVTKAALTIRADDKTMSLHGTVPPLTATYTGLVNSDTPSSLSSPAVLSTTATSSSNIGDYPITVSGAASNNYTITFASGTMKVRYASNSGILQPINAAAPYSVFKQGSTVPAKIKVFDANGLSIGDPGTIKSFQLVQRINGVDTFSVTEEVISTTPDNAFRWDASGQQWIFNINTKSLTANCTYVYRVTLKDDSVIEFRFGLK